MAQKYSLQIMGRLFWFVANAQILNKQHKYDNQSKRNEKLKFAGYLISWSNKTSRAASRNSTIYMVKWIRHAKAFCYFTRSVCLQALAFNHQLKAIPTNQVTSQRSRKQLFSILWGRRLWLTLPKYQLTQTMDFQSYRRRSTCCDTLRFLVL